MREKGGKASAAERRVGGEREGINSREDGFDRQASCGRQS